MREEDICAILIQVLQEDPNPRVRAAAAISLARACGDSDVAIAAMIGAVRNEPDPRVREVEVILLGWMEQQRGKSPPPPPPPPPPLPSPPSQWRRLLAFFMSKKGRRFARTLRTIVQTIILLPAAYGTFRLIAGPIVAWWATHPWGLP